MYTYKVEGRIKKKKNRTKKSKNSRTSCTKILTREHLIKKTMNSIQAQKVFPMQANTLDESYGTVKFSFDVYKESIQNEYNLHLRMKEEEAKRQMNLIIPSPS
jgi:hypothetical protein